MALTLEQIEYLHDIGKMPDWAYYQQNGKTAQQNYVEQKRKMRKETEEQLNRMRQQEQMEEDMYKILKKVINRIEKELAN